MYPEEVIKMPLTDFEKMFGFRPEDALAKKWFAISGKQITDVVRAFAELEGEMDLSEVVMHD